MFRQVVMNRWRPGTSEAAKQDLRDAVEQLRQIPEVVSLRFGDDGRYFEGNHDFVLVLDFADFAAARRYVDAPEHRSFIADHVTQVTTDRVVVQHDWGQGQVVGLHHAKLPVTDVARSRDWYGQAFGFVTAHEFGDEGAPQGVALQRPGTDFTLALRHDPDRARALAGFDAVCLAVGTDDDLAAVLAHLDRHGIGHTAPVDGHRGRAADVPDPDGLVVRLHTYG